MSTNLIAISIGNTRTQIAPIVDGTLGEIGRADNEDTPALAAQLRAADGALEAAGDAPVVIASVDSQALEPMLKLVHDLLDREVLRIEVDVNAPIGRKLDPETLVGEDRLLNAAAAFDKLQQACIVIDAGTAVTVDFIDGDGTFHGGAILPGVQMQLDAMHDHTDALPDVTFTPPNEAIGHSTAQAMLTGVFHGTRGAVRELAEKYAEQYGAYPKIIATGGSAAQLFTDYELVEEIMPELTLEGIAVARRRQIEADQA